VVDCQLGYWDACAARRSDPPLTQLALLCGGDSPPMIKHFGGAVIPPRKRVVMASSIDKRSTVLGAVEDASRRLAGAASGILDRPCAQRSGGRQVGTEGWPT
jgi:hypothetical protein